MADTHDTETATPTAGAAEPTPELTALVRRLARLTAHRRRGFLHEEGLHPAEWRALKTLAGGAHGADDTDPLLARLEARGLAHWGDVGWEITPAGHRMGARVRTHETQADTLLVEAVGAEEAARTARALAAMIDALSGQDASDGHPHGHPHPFRGRSGHGGHPFPVRFGGHGHPRHRGW